MRTRFNREMLDRMTEFGINVCRMAHRSPHHHSAAVLAKQVARSSTSIGANYREAQWARTPKEGLSKLQIALQEAEETRHWFATIEGAGHTSNDETRPLIRESSELIAILVASINTTRRRTGN